ncbi:NUDIX hydrolase [Actinomadura violacea]|uniref:NUDIX domain-containing protein n=1 Tax=Actinomadura violacea TaxID=2819934 RepID=A0ABS3RYB9_9ACTN|nr:NUDIX domain-containing protein [Actinomadura violacea]MBO2461759.1 NUDIX domain-containing protein [Actinomadura violacea]
MRTLAPLIADTHLLLSVPDGRILMMIRSGTGYMDGHAGLPSGHVESGESADAAIVREAKEELGIVVQPDDLRFVHVMHRRSVDEPGSRVSFFYSAATWVGEVVNAEPAKCAGLVWADPAGLDQVPVPVIGYIADAVAAVAAGERYSACGW